MGREAEASIRELDATCARIHHASVNNENIKSRPVVKMVMHNADLSGGWSVGAMGRCWVA